MLEDTCDSAALAGMAVTATIKDTQPPSKASGSRCNGRCEECAAARRFDFLADGDTTDE